MDTNTANKTELDKQIGQRIITFRKQNGITQKRLGQVLGVSFQQVQKYEWGKSRLSVRAAQQISEYFGVSPMVLF